MIRVLRPVVMVLASAGPALAGADPGPLVAGVGRITSGGASGPVHPMSQDWWAIAAGDDDASFPSLYAMARTYGAGRVVVLGHEGLLAGTDLLDNGTFAINALQWLDVAGNGAVRYGTGHAEWATGSALSGLAALAAGQGMTVDALPGPITAGSLSGASVLIVGNAWGVFSGAEVDAVEQWVQGGGGLLLAGLGWSWTAFHPGQTMDDYPMMQLAAPYQVRWLGGVVNDPTDHVNGSAIFSTLYPQVDLVTVPDALDLINDRHAALGATLPDQLESDPALRLDFVRADLTLAIPAAEFPAGHPQRQDVFDGYTALALGEPDFYARGFSFDQTAHPTAAHLRERAWRSWRDALSLTADRKATIAAAGQLAGRRLDIFGGFDLVALDNDRLGPPELELIHTYLTLIPQDLPDLWSISVKAYLGAPPLDVGLDGTPYGVNIFGIAIGDITENPFPGDVDRSLADTFSSVVAHEMNHVVDATSIGPAPAMAARRDQLIADAGTDPQNYLRSMFDPGFFVNAPQEFFASISNQWMNDSALTLELGLVRFDAGRLDPINQALFFADVYARGTDTTLFYVTDTSGNVRRTEVGLTRDAADRIIALQNGPTHHAFELDEAGRVTGHQQYLGCAVDVTDDGVVGIDDFSSVIVGWGACGPLPADCPADVTCDRQVGIDDLAEIIVHWDQ